MGEGIETEGRQEEERRAEGRGIERARGVDEPACCCTSLRRSEEVAFDIASRSAEGAAEGETSRRAEEGGWLRTGSWNCEGRRERERERVQHQSEEVDNRIGALWRPRIEARTVVEVVVAGRVLRWRRGWTELLLTKVGVWRLLMMRKMLLRWIRRSMTGRMLIQRVGLLYPLLLLLSHRHLLLVL